MQKDWNKKLEVDLSYFGSDTGDNAPATIIIRGQGTTTGWHYYKLSVNKIVWKEGEGKYPIGEWFKKDGSSFQTNDYSDTWQDVEAVLFSGDVTISEAANQLENGRNGIPMLAGYILKSKEREIRDGSIDHEAGIQTITLPVVLDSTPLDAALTPEEVLGDAHEFGIVADTYNQDGHTETNFAVHHLRFTPSGQNLDIDGSGEGPIPFYAGDVVNNFRFGQNQNVDAFLYMTQSDIDARSIAQDKDTYQVTVIPTPKDEIDGYVRTVPDGLYVVVL